MLQVPAVHGSSAVDRVVCSCACCAWPPRCGRTPRPDSKQKFCRRQHRYTRGPRHLKPHRIHRTAWAASKRNGQSNMHDIHEYAPAHGIQARRCGLTPHEQAGGRQMDLPGMHKLRRRGCARQRPAREALRAPRDAQHAPQRTPAARRPATTPPGRTAPPAQRRAAPSRARAQRRCRRFGGGPRWRSRRSRPGPQGWLVARCMRGMYVSTRMGAPTPGRGCRARRHCRGARDRKSLTWRVCRALRPRHRNRQCVCRGDPRERC